MERRPRVVLVDDEPFMARVVSTVLVTHGFDVAICEEWTGVARAVRAEKPDLVLLDYNMPGLKGDSICAILKRNCTNDDMKIVLFSSEPQDQLERIANACGADGCIPKNTPSDDFVKRVRAVIAGTSTAHA